MTTMLEDIAAPGTTVPAHTLTGPPHAPVIAVLGGISATRHVCAADDTGAGWWDGVAGPGRAIDTRHTRVLGLDFIDGGNVGTGQPARECTTHDQADALRRAMDDLGIATIDTLVGASYGGMVALAFAERYPARVARLAVISAAHEPHPMSTALRTLQRRIVELGLDTGRAADALSIARGIAMTTYRTALEFEERFAVDPIREAANGPAFPVDDYLRHCGERFAAAWDPARFLALSLSCDTHRVDPRRIATPALLISAEHDTLVPAAQMALLSRQLGGPTRHVTLPTRYGHDTFLIEQAAIGQLLAPFLTPLTTRT